MKIFPSLRRFARSIEEKGRTSRNGIVLALRLHFWSRVGQLLTFDYLSLNLHYISQTRRAKFGSGHPPDAGRRKPIFTALDSRVK